MVPLRFSVIIFPATGIYSPPIKDSVILYT